VLKRRTVIACGLNGWFINGQIDGCSRTYRL
jgi:hypothetical protein